MLYYKILQKVQQKLRLQILFAIFIMVFMRVVIVGAGMIGIHIARELIEEKRDAVIIEKNPEIARMVENQLDCLVIHDDGTRPETLRQGGTSSADWFIALTGSDSVNIVACGLVAAESN